MIQPILKGPGSVYFVRSAKQACYSKTKGIQSSARGNRNPHHFLQDYRLVFQPHQLSLRGVNHKVLQLFQLFNNAFDIFTLKVIFEIFDELLQFKVPVRVLFRVEVGVLIFFVFGSFFLRNPVEFFLFLFVCGPLIFCCSVVDLALDEPWCSLQSRGSFTVVISPYKKLDKRRYAKNCTV